MNDGSVAIAALGVLATSVGLMAWVVKKVLGEVAPALLEHAKTATELGAAVKRNTESNEEMLKFMKNLNGKLAKATIKTAREARQ